MNDLSPTTWRPVPQVVRDAAMPTRVRVYEVGPRDGLQAEPEILSTGVKIELCRRLLDAGIGALEVTSFVPPRLVPQLADADDVLTGLGSTGDSRAVVLVPNLRGLERAVAANAREVAVVASASESFARANLNTDLDGSVARARDVIQAATARGLRVRAYLSMAFGDPWEGPVDAATVARIAGELDDAGATTIAIGDTIGTGTPAHVERVIQSVLDTGVPVERLALHFHDTYGQALANVHTALRLGVVEFDSSVGGLGRCPFARGATGNLATEDLIWMLHSLGIETGVDLNLIVRVSHWLSRHLGRPVPSRVATALIAAGIR